MPESLNLLLHSSFLEHVREAQVDVAAALERTLATEREADERLGPDPACGEKEEPQAHQQEDWRLP